MCFLYNLFKALVSFWLLKWCRGVVAKLLILLQGSPNHSKITNMVSKLRKLHQKSSPDQKNTYKFMKDTRNVTKIMRKNLPEF